jgi:hypothetical protein
MQTKRVRTQLYYKLTGNISTAPFRGFFERTVPVTLGVVVDAFTVGTETGEVILFLLNILHSKRLVLADIDL